MYWRDGDKFEMKRELARGEFRCASAVRRGTKGEIVEVKYGEAWVRFEDVKTSKGPAEASFPVTELAGLISPMYTVQQTPEESS